MPLLRVNNPSSSTWWTWKIDKTTAFRTWWPRFHLLRKSPAKDHSLTHEDSHVSLQKPTLPRTRKANSICSTYQKFNSCVSEAIRSLCYYTRPCVHSLIVLKGSCCRKPGGWLTGAAVETLRQTWNLQAYATLDWILSRHRAGRSLPFRMVGVALSAISCRQSWVTEKQKHNVLVIGRNSKATNEMGTLRLLPQKH